MMGFFYFKETLMNERILQLENDVDELYSRIEKLEEIISMLKVENHSHVHYEIKNLLIKSNTDNSDDNFPEIFNN